MYATQQLDTNPPHLFAVLRRRLGQAWAFNWPLTLSVLLYVVLIPAYSVLAVVDPRIITGMPAWIKPLKFILSSVIYLGTFLWLLTFVQGRKRLVRWVALLTSLGFLVENVVIGIQVVRGTTSHFNISTTFDGIAFSLMGGFVTVIAVLNLLVGMYLLFQRLPNPVVAWAVRLGLLISFVGMMTGFLMTSQVTPAQQAQMDAGQMPASMGAHSVGVEDGGAGLPLVGWSTEGGDLRVGHFVGLHGMQALPLLGWLLMRPALRRRYDVRRRTLLVWLGGFFYLGLTLLTTWQALRGQPLLAPDAVTLAALAALIGLTGLGVLFTTWRAAAPLPVTAQPTL